MNIFKRAILTTAILSTFSFSVSAQEIPESLIKKENSNETKNASEERITIENKPVKQSPAKEETETEDSSNERIIIENKPVREVPATEENKEKLKKEMTSEERKKVLSMNFRYKLKEYNVETCYAPLSQIISSLTESPNIKTIETRSTLIESDKAEPVIFMDYAVVSNSDPQYSSINLSLQAIPYEDNNTCLLIETNDTVLNNVDNCSVMLDEADNSGNPDFVDEGTFSNQFEKNKNFRKVKNQLLTLNDIKEGGCHVRSVSYSQYINQDNDEKENSD